MVLSQLISITIKLQDNTDKSNIRAIQSFIPQNNLLCKTDLSVTHVSFFWLAVSVYTRTESE